METTGLYRSKKVVLDIVAPILLMPGINATTSANVSLLNNFELLESLFR